MPALPARVRVSRLPLPPTPAVMTRLHALFAGAGVPFSELSAGAAALAGGKVIGAARRWSGGRATRLESGWRGRGIEEALSELLDGPQPDRADTAQNDSEQGDSDQSESDHSSSGPT